MTVTLTQRMLHNTDQQECWRNRRHEPSISMCRWHNAFYTATTTSVSCPNRVLSTPPASRRFRMRSYLSVPPGRHGLHDLRPKHARGLYGEVALLATFSDSAIQRAPDAEAVAVEHVRVDHRVFTLRLPSSSCTVRMS